MRRNPFAKGVSRRKGLSERTARALCVMGLLLCGLGVQTGATQPLCQPLRRRTQRRKSRECTGALTREPRCATPLARRPLNARFGTRGPRCAISLAPTAVSARFEAREARFPRNGGVSCQREPCSEGPSRQIAHLGSVMPAPHQGRSILSHEKSHPKVATHKKGVHLPRRPSQGQTPYTRDSIRSDESGAVPLRQRGHGFLRYKRDMTALRPG